MLSKTTWGIIVLEIIATAAMLLLSLRYSWAGLVPALASTGGMIVFLGLWIEKEAEEEKSRTEHLGSPIKSKEGFGWTVLMVGIVVEIATACGLAFYDVHEQQRFSDASNPLNKLVTDLAAEAYFEVRGDKVADVSPYKVPPLKMGIAELWLSETNGLGTIFPILYADNFGRMHGILSDDTRGYSLRFHENGMAAMFAQTRGNAWAVSKITTVRFLWMSFSFLTNNADIASGTVFLVINGGSGGVRRTFHIPPQRPSPCGTADNVSYWVCATNFTATLETELR
jgi:hypothetical protein